MKRVQSLRYLSLALGSLLLSPISIEASPLEKLPTTSFLQNPKRVEGDGHAPLSRFHQELFKELSNSDYSIKTTNEMAQIFHDLVETLMVKESEEATAESQETPFLTRSDKDIKNIQKEQPLPTYMAAKTGSVHPAFIKEVTLPFLPSDKSRITSGNFHFKGERWRAAASQFSKVSPTNSTMYPIAQFQMARVLLSQEKHGEAENLLENLGSSLEREDPLYDAIHLLRGEIAYQTKDFARANRHFSEMRENAISERSHFAAAALRRQVSACRSISLEGQTGDVERQICLDEGERLLRELISFDKKGRDLLELSRLYLQSLYLLGKPETLEKLQKLPQEEHDFLVEEGVVMEVRLLATAALSTFEERREEYLLLTDKEYSDKSLRTNAWFYFGLNLFDEALRTPSDNFLLLKKALHALNRVVKLTSDAPIPLTHRALKHQVEVLYTLGGEKELNQALEICQELFGRASEIGESEASPQESLYLLGLVAYKLSMIDSSKAEVASKALRWLKVWHPNGIRAKEALHLLGKVQYGQQKYEEAEKTFLAVGKNFASSPEAPEAWHWAAKCALKQGKDQALARFYQKTLNERYPDTEFADDVSLDTPSPR